jgi:glycosyltransferase involved in cell wall biosynthesis
VSQAPKFSVLMTMYNGAPFLRAAVESVLGQTLADFEFVVVDDGSTDESVRIVRAFGDPRIRLHVSDHNLGQTTALNVGLRLCRGDYVARMDADDVCRFDRLARQAAALDADPALGIVGSAVRIIDALGRPLDLSTQPLDDATIRFVSLTRNPFHHPTVAIRRRVLLDHGLEYDERFQANQDFELWTRLLPLTHAANLPQTLLDYRVHGANISVVRLAEQQRTSVDFCRKRQIDEGIESPIDSKSLYEIFDAIHGSRIVGEPRVEDASRSVRAFLDLAAVHARAPAAQRWAAGLAVRAALLGRVGRARVDILARSHRLCASAAVETVRMSVPTLYFRARRALDAPSPDPRTLAIVVASLRVGGTERHLGAVLPALAREGWRITVIRTGADGPIGALLRSAGIEVIGVDTNNERVAWLPSPLRGLVAYVMQAWPIARAIARRNAAIVHAFLPGPTVVAAIACAFARKPTFLSSRRALNLYQKQNPRSALLEKLALGRARAILGNSRAVMRDLEFEGYAASRVTLLANGIPPNIDTPSPRAMVRAKEGWPEDEVVVVIVANLLPYKGHLDLIEAAARLPADLPRWSLCLVGRDDGAGGEIAARAAAFGLAHRVRFLGERADVAALLGASDIAVSASHEEGFSNSVIEAMAEELPVVGTAVGGTTDAILDGETGLLVPPREPDAMARALAALIADPARRRELGVAARARATRHFSLSACVRNYSALYSGLVRAPAARPSDLVTAPDFGKAET